MMGTLGISLLGGVAGVINDKFGPTIPILSGSLCLFLGYLTIYYSYVHQIRIIGLLACGSCLAGFGSTLAYSASMKTAALNFPNQRGTAVAFPIAAFGLSAFFFSMLSAVVFPGNTAGFLGLLAVLTSALLLINAPFVKPHPVPQQQQQQFDENNNLRTNSYSKVNQEEEEEEEERTAALSYGAIEDTYSSRPIGAGGPFSRHYSQSTLISSPLGSSVPNELMSSSSGPSTRFPSRRESFNHPPPPPVTAFSRIPSIQSISTLIPDSSTPLSSSSSSSPKGQSSKGQSFEIEQEHSVKTWDMLKTMEFWTQFAVLGLLSGTAQMYIYCCGYIVRALVLSQTEVSGLPDLSSVQSTQSLQVALISIFSFVGRMLSGSLSDVFSKRYKCQRLWMVLIASALTLVANLLMITSISKASLLWIPSCLVGLSYGMTFGVFATIVCDTFGIIHFSKNWGFVGMSPVFTVYAFNMLFGSVYDSNSASTEELLLLISASSTKVAGTVTSTAVMCLKGTACYSEAFKITSWVSGLAFILVSWMIYTEKHQPKKSTVIHHLINDESNQV